MKLKSLFLVVLAVCTFSACKDGNEPSSTNDSTRNDGSWIRINDLRSEASGEAYCSMSFYSKQEAVEGGLCYKPMPAGTNPTIANQIILLYSGGMVMYQNLNFQLNSDGSGSINGTLSNLLPGTFVVRPFMKYGDATVVYGDSRTVTILGSEPSSGGQPSSGGSQPSGGNQPSYSLVGDWNCTNQCGYWNLHLLSDYTGTIEINSTCGDSPSHTTNNISCVYNSQTGHIDLYIQSEDRVYHQERDIQWINANQFYVLIEAGTEYEEILGPFNRV